MRDEINPHNFLTEVFRKTSLLEWGEGMAGNQVDQREKVYPRLVHHLLPDPEFPEESSLKTSLQERCTALEFSSLTFSLREISTLLGAVGKRSGAENRRLYPSAGAKYPIETYLIVLDCEALPQGLYHYEIGMHRLAEIWKKDFREEIFAATNDSRVFESSIVLIFSSVHGRTEEKYGERGLRYSLIEIGHMAQNISLAAAMLKFGCCEIGGFIDSTVNAWLDVEEESEAAALLILLGGERKP